MIGIPVKDRGVDPIIDERFGRSQLFCIVNDKDEFHFIDNSAKTLTSGAGGQAVSLLADEDVTTIISPHVGPKAITAIKALNIKVYDMGNTTTVKEALQSLKENTLKIVETNSTGLKRV